MSEFKSKSILFYFLLLCLGFSVFLNVFILFQFKQSVEKIPDFSLKKPETSFPNKTSGTQPVSETLVENGVERTYVRARGIIKKEVMPKDMELGEYWYWFYFDNPYVLENNAAGFPMKIDKIWVYAPTDNSAYDIDKFLDQPVEVYGYETWGYAESTVLQLVTITKIKEL